MGSDEKGGPLRRPRVIGRPRVLPGPLADLKALLYQLYLQAGTPTLDQIASWIAEDKHGNLAGAPARDTIARIIGDAGMPPSQADVRTWPPCWPAPPAGIRMTRPAGPATCGSRPR